MAGASSIGRTSLVQRNLVVVRGSDQTFRFRWSTGKPPVHVDLTGWTGRITLRQTATSPDVWLTSTTVTLGADGMIRLDLSRMATAGPEWNARQVGVWDLVLSNPSGLRTRFAEGAVTISHGVTRA